MTGLDVMASVVNLSLGGFFSGMVMRKAFNSYVVTSSSGPESLLKVCKTGLEVVEWRLKRLTPGQREVIYALAEKKQCKSLEYIEIEMRR
jgi:hypothetical protein